jgi:hypothetical protein
VHDSLSVGLIGVGKQEAFQLLWNASVIFYGLFNPADCAVRKPDRVRDKITTVIAIANAIGIALFKGSTRYWVESL